VPVWQGRSKSLEDTIKEVPEFREAVESSEENKRLVDVAKTLEGVSRNVSTHAAGVVIAPEPLVHYTPLQYGPGREAVITQYDMKAVGDIGLLKIDFLGLQNLDIIATCLRLIEERRAIDIDIDKIPFDDAKTFELLANADTHGVFQLEGAGMRRMLTDMRPQGFEDVAAAVALFRPGPMVNIPAFIARKQGREPIEYMHERLEPILRDTYGVMIYQEQVMMAAREIAGSRSAKPTSCGRRWARRTRSRWPGSAPSSSTERSSGGSPSPPPRRCSTASPSSPSTASTERIRRHTGWSRTRRLT
jgi:DNA polymerase-3 subunit alpha